MPKKDRKELLMTSMEFWQPVALWGKHSPTTSVNNEPINLEFGKGNSDNGKFRNKHKGETYLAGHAERRLHKKTQEKNRTTKTIYGRKIRAAKKKIKFSRKKADDVRVNFSARSCISTARNFARALNMSNPKRNQNMTRFLRTDPL